MLHLINETHPWLGALVAHPVRYNGQIMALNLSQNMQKRSQNAKNERSTAGYFVSLFSLFAFHSISRQGQHSHEKSKDFVVYFFTALIKHEIRMKSEKCIVNVLYSVKTFAKYKKCIASFMLYIYTSDGESSSIRTISCDQWKLHCLNFCHCPIKYETW